jgi:hypothetical protein
VRNTDGGISFEPIYYGKDDQFPKTGSGKRLQRDSFFAGMVEAVCKGHENCTLECSDYASDHPPQQGCNVTADSGTARYYKLPPPCGGGKKSALVVNCSGSGGGGKGPTCKARSHPDYVSGVTDAYGRGATSFFGVVSLCLSRACLGKMMQFIYKWRKHGGAGPLWCDNQLFAWLRHEPVLGNFRFPCDFKKLNTNGHVCFAIM